MEGFMAVGSLVLADPLGTLATVCAVSAFTIACSVLQCSVSRANTNTKDINKQAERRQQNGPRTTARNAQQP